MTTKIIAISDIHCEPLQNILGDTKADLLIIAGDMTYRGTVKEMSKFFKQLDEANNNFKFGSVMIYGNHELGPEKDPDLFESMLPTNTKLLHNTEIVINGLRIWGNPFTTRFYDWAFNVGHKEIRKVWEQIPEGLDILISHGPPNFLHHGVGLDKNLAGDHCGDVELESIVCREMVKPPKVHYFGHIHSNKSNERFYDNGRTKFYNISVMNEHYDPEWGPTVCYL